MEFGDVLGRKVANTTFLSALFAADPFDEYHFYLSGREEAGTFSGNITAMNPDRASKVKVFTRSDLPRGLAEHAYHVFHLSDCITHQPALARVRNRYSAKIFPITGVTHSLSYAHYGAPLLAHLSPTTSGRDCIVSTSRTGVEVVRRALSGLREAYGLDQSSHPGPAVRRVPLGVDTQALAPVDDDGKQQARTRLGLDPERTVFLVFGRLSHYSKMDLLPLLRAMKRAKAMGLDPDRCTLALAGWTEEGEQYHEALSALAETLGVDCRIFARPDEACKLDLFHAADLFVSIADNPQETFGITIIEAMAAGLPVVASRYDGYRDLVRDGETGLLVDTIVPQHTDDIDAMALLRFGSDSHLELAQQTVVEVPALAKALVQLGTDPALRKSLGTAGRDRAVARYDWSCIIEEYVRLWDELWEMPDHVGGHMDGHDLNGPHPMEMRYGRLFGHYGHAPEDAMVLAMSQYGEDVYRGRTLPVVYPGVAHLVEGANAAPNAATNAAPDLGRLKKLLFLARKAVCFSEAVRQLAEGGSSDEEARFLVLWAMKHDLLERVS